MPDNRGFSLIELVVSVAVLSILTTVAIPGFSRLIESTRLTSATNALTTALQLARSEAINRNAGVQVCPGDDPTDCTQSWALGWQVTLTADNSVIKQWEAPPSDVTLVQQGGSALIQFRGNGQSQAAAQVGLKRYGCTGTETDGRQISISAIGRASVRDVACSSI